MTKRTLLLFALALVASPLLDTACQTAPEKMVIPVAPQARTSIAVNPQRGARREKAISKLKEDYPQMPDALYQALNQTPRRRFVSQSARHRSYQDYALPIGSQQATLKLSEIVEIFTLLDIQPSDRVFELGTGSGFTAALLSRLAAEVYSSEIIEYLVEIAKKNLAESEIKNVRIRNADGQEGWPYFAPFDKVLITAAVKSLPPKLLLQLKDGGHIAAPLLDDYGDCLWYVYQKNGDALKELGKKRCNIAAIIQPQAP